MIKYLRLTRRALLALLLLLFSALATGYLGWRIRQAEATFPPATTDLPVIAERGYGVTIDLTQYDEAELDAALNDLQAARLTWLRLPLRWAEIEPERGQFDWQAYDLPIEVAALRGFRLIAVLDTSPTWARPDGTASETPPLEMADFGEFARQVALRYGDQIQYYQIWHEPNLSERWGNRHVDAAQYVLLLKNAAIPLRAVQPEAKILTAALAPTTESGPLNLNEATYLQQIYQAGAAPWFDILAAQLYGFHLPVLPVERDPQVLSIHRVQWLRQVMQANGDGRKPIWATAFGWHALPAAWTGQPTTWPSDSPEVQRQRTAAAIDYARANWPWLGPMLAIRWDGVGLTEDDPTRGFAINPDLLPPFEAASQAKVDVASSGSYPASHASGFYSPGWRFAGDLADVPTPTVDATESPTLTITFEGTRLDLIVNRGFFRGYLRVTIDGAPSPALPLDERGRSYVVLYDPLRKTATVPIARYLPDGPHQAIIEAEGGWGEWTLAGWSVYREADTRLWQRGLMLALAGVALGAGGLLGEIGRQWRVIWSTWCRWWTTFSEMFRRQDDRLQIAEAFGLVLAFYFLPAPLALLALPVIALVFALRLDIGLLVLSFGISFFLAKKSVLVGSPSLLELGLFLVVAATLFRLGLALLQSRSLSLPNLRLRGSDWAALVLLALATVTTFTALNFGVAMYELRTLVIGSVVFYGLIRLVPWLEQSDHEALALRLSDAFVAGATVHAALALFQYFVTPTQTIDAEGVRRAIGYFYGSPNNLSLFLDRAFPILLVIALFDQPGPRRWTYAFGLLVVGGTLFLTYSKGALLVVVPTTILLFALVRGGRTAWLGAGSVLIMLGYALVPLSRTERFRSTFSLQPGSTTFFRLKVWQSGWEMLTDQPLTGVGLDNFLYAYRTRYILPDAWQEPNLSHPHNLFLDFGTRLGLGGIIVLVWLLWQFWSSAIKTYRRLTNRTIKALLLGLMGSMLAFLSHGLIDNSYFLVDLAYTFFLSLGLVELLRARPNAESGETN